MLLTSFQKVYLYLLKRTWKYIQKLPSNVLWNIIIIIIVINILPFYNYLDFVSTLLDVSSHTIQTFRPCKESQKILIKAYKESMSPSTGETPCSFEEALSLYFIIRILKPKVVIETGVSAGRSSAYILCGLHDNNVGVLYSIDPYSEAGYAIPQILKDRWHFVNTTSKDSLCELLSKKGTIDLFLHDSLHTYDNMLWEYEIAWPYVEVNGLLISHDVDWNSAFRDFCNHISAKLVYLNSGFVAAKKR